MKKVRLAAAFLAIALALTSCQGASIFSSYRPIEDLDLVRTIAVDRGEETDVLICASTTGEKPKIRMFSQSAENLAVALGLLQNTPTGGITDLSHTEHLVIGEDAAKEGVSEYLDYVLRYGEIRLDANLFIVRGEARDLMRGVAGEESSPAAVLSRLKEKLPREGTGFVFTCKDAAIAMAENGCALAMAIETVDEDALFEGLGEKRAVPAGFALLADGKLAGFLTEEESLGALMLHKKFKSLKTRLDIPNGSLTVSVNEAAVTITPVVRDSSVTGFDIVLDASANVINTAPGAPLMDEDVRRAAEDELNSRLLSAIEAAVVRAQTEDRDFLGLTSLAERASPNSFDKDAFADSFSDLEFTVTGRAKLTRTYDLTNSLNNDGREAEPWKELIS